MKKKRETTRKAPAEASVEKPTKAPGEKGDRERERVPILGELRGEVMIFQAMTVLDISYGGAQIETAFPLQLDSLHEFRLTLGERSIVVKGRIAHSHIGDLDEERVGYRTGVEFIDPPEHARKVIMAFIESLKASRGSRGSRGS